MRIGQGGENTHHDLQHVLLRDDLDGHESRDGGNADIEVEATAKACGTLESGTCCSQFAR